MTIHTSRPDARPTWDDLTPEEQITELRLESASEFYAEFEDDPAVWIDCPRDGRIVVGADAECPHCCRDVLNPWHMREEVAA